ncbi:DMT family transporter [Alicyclobacillus fastidiosus]|uniref:DMT family transporter n=1 Tax=Alicyclobacillus fastidiosus TaxID=392011 RepID=A0ABY6ZHL3_9BACL|nr:DMT family transporter [Alicyclobacillus fastidiosus]WAH42379.1 DMT family transporter [Alicyclobacillus fastidiosus]
MNSRYLGGLYMALAASIWGGMYVVSKVLLQNIEPLALVWLRYVVTLFALAISILATKQSWRVSWRHVPLVVVIGVVGYAVSIWTQFLGTKLSTAQMGAMITSATPAFMVVFGRILLSERITLRKAMSVGLATIGVLLIVGIGGFSHSYQLGGVILCIAALTWALMSVFVKLVPSGYSQLTITLYGILVATVCITPIAVKQMVDVSPSTWLQPSLWGGVLYLGVVSTAGAFFLWNKGLQLVDASSGGLYFFFQPLVGTFLGWLILGEVVGLSFWVGALLILIGVAIVVREVES